MKKLENIIHNGIGGIFILFFVPLLMMVCFGGNHVKYWDAMKLQTLCPNPVLAVMAIVSCVVAILMLKLGKRIQMTPKLHIGLDVFLVVFWTLVYFLNLYASRQIAFMLPYDVSVVRGAAMQIAKGEAMGYQSYFSIYPNNIPIIYFMGKTLKHAMEHPHALYEAQYIWIQIGCLFVSISGFFACMLVKQITKNIAAVGIALALIFQLVASSAWKMVPYTDSFGIPFAVMAIYFYMKYKEVKKPLIKGVYIALALLCGVVGGAIKASVYLTVIAILATECIRLLTEYKKIWKYVVLQIACLFVFVGTQKTLNNIWLEKIGLEYNEEVSVSWQHYFAMGLNERTTGGYDEYYVSIVGQYQYDRPGRIAAELELAKQAFRDRGFGGSVLFYARKLVMTYNDGLFGFGTEVWEDPYSKYQITLADNNKSTDFLRNVYWNGPYVGRFNTIAQFLWIFCMVTFPGAVFACFWKKERGNNVLVVAFLGILFYQMLFEARARYLFVFLPLLIAMAVYGLSMYGEVFAVWKEKGKNVFYRKK